MTQFLLFIKMKFIEKRYYISNYLKKYEFIILQFNNLLYSLFCEKIKQNFIFNQKEIRKKIIKKSIILQLN